jgi:hypothetical protein
MTSPRTSTGRTNSPAVIGKDIRAVLSGVVRDVMLDATQALIAATPVDTGHAASNWILSTGSPHSGVDGSREAVSTGAQDAGLAAIERYDVGKDGKVYLVNNVDYIGDLDQGSSPQAGAGFVARALLSGVSAAPKGRKTAARKMLKGMAKTAFKRGA